MRDAAQVLVADREKIPADEARRGLTGQHRDARRGRMDPEQERLELETLRAGDDDLAIDDAPFRELLEERRCELRKVLLCPPR